MIFITSPAKTLNFESDWNADLVSTPEFSDKAWELVSQLKKESLAELQQSLQVSEKLAELNHKRFQSFDKNPKTNKAKPALLAYMGDIYRQMTPQTYSDREQAYAQKNLRIITGLYGVLKAYDLIQPYRLEKKLKYQTKYGKNLYEFWGRTLTESLEKELSQHKNQVLINLASKEYSKAINLKNFTYPAYDIEFRQIKNGEEKNTPIFSKIARGMMLEFCIKNNVKDLEGIKKFNTENYIFDREEGNKLFFVRQYPN